MLPLLATSLATVAGVMLFGGDFTRLFFVFPTYQITSFKIVDFSLSLPSMVAPSSQSLWALYEDTFCKDKSRWQCLVWDWDGFSRIVNSIEADIVNYVTNWGEEKPLVTADAHSYAKFEISAEIHAGISINNSQNSFGAHLHRAILDIYHPDWEGTLVNIGSITDREKGRGSAFQSGPLSSKVYRSMLQSESVVSVLKSEYSSHNTNSTLILSDRHENTTDCLWEDLIIHGFESPSFSIPPRQVIHTVEDAIAIHLKSLSPKVLLNMAYHFIRNGKVLHITSTAVVYLKTLTSPMSITAGAICDNSLKFTPSSIYSVWRSEKTPWFNIDEVDCRIERLSTGWGDIAKLRGELRELMLSRYAKAG
jgi:hypothetical protein